MRDKHKADMQSGDHSRPFILCTAVKRMILMHFLHNFEPTLDYFYSLQYMGNMMHFLKCSSLL